MDFALFILVNAILFVRPAEIVPALVGMPIYNVVILCCLATCFPQVLAQLGLERLRKQPVIVCVLGVLAMIVVSNVANHDSYTARTMAPEFAKVVLYFLILVGVVNTPARLRAFLGWLVLFIGILTALALLQYHEYIELPSLKTLERVKVDEETGDILSVERQLCATGNFNDPNDYSLILVVGIILSLYRLCDRRSGPLRAAWAAPILLFFYALLMTRSRGGLLGLLAGLFVLFVARFGWRKAIPLAAVALPALLLLVGGRQAQISTSADTAHERIELWIDGFQRLRQRPLFGVGSGHFADSQGLVAHNSFIHAYTEMGLVGGTFFFAWFYLAPRRMYWLGKHLDELADPDLRAARPFVMAMLAGYAMGLYSLSRCYIVSTSTMVGIGAAYLNLAEAEVPGTNPAIDGRLVRELGVASLAFLGLMNGFVKVAH